MKRFSPYHLSAASQIAALVLIAAVIVLLVSRLDPLIALIVAVAGLLFVRLSPYLFVCPQCGKGVRDFDPRIGGTWLQKRRIWPERECSGCGTRLDVI